MKQLYTVWIAECYSCQKDIIQALRHSNLNQSLKIFASHRLARPELVLYADHFEQQPEIQQSGEWLLQQCIDHHVDLLFCGKHSHFVEHYREQFEFHQIQLVTGAVGVAHHTSMNDKYEFTLKCQSLNLPYIPCGKACDLEQLKTEIARYQSQYDSICAKPVHGVYGAGFVQLRDDVDYFKKFQISSICNTQQFIEAYAHLNPPIDYLIMLYLSGQECSVDIACDRGEILAQVTRTKFDFFQICDLEHPCHTICVELVKQFQCDGLINIQFKQDEKLNWHILEINPRPAGGFAYTQHTGVNLVAELIAHKLKLILQPHPKQSQVKIMPLVESIQMESDVS